VRRAAFEIAAGTHTFEIARMMGTSVEQISATYGHLLPSATQAAIERMDAFDVGPRGYSARSPGKGNA
jgi:hypothetical protein